MQEELPADARTAAASRLGIGRVHAHRAAGGDAIIAVLIGLLLPAVQKVREAAARMEGHRALAPLAARLVAFADGIPTIQGGVWQAVTGAVNGSEGDSLDMTVLRKLHGDLLDHEQKNVDLLTEIGDMLEAKHLPHHQRALLREAQSAPNQSLDGLRKIKAAIPTGAPNPE